MTESRISPQPVVSRRVRTPDGLDHLVSLQAGWWDCLDWMIRSRGERLEDIVGFCWRFVLDHPGDRFGDVFEYYLHRYMGDVRSDEAGLANDNWSIGPRATKTTDDLP